MTVKTIRQIARRQHVRLFVAGIAALLLWDAGSVRPLAQVVTNPIKAENALPGNDDSQWDIAGAGDPTIQGFATDISVNTGQTVNFKIKTDSVNYKIDIYRLGYYAGNGARRVASLGTFTQAQNQTVNCTTDPATGLVDCGNWSVSASWTSTGAVSGIYIAKLTRSDGTGGASHIVFIVRDDARKADMLVQTSDTTWQAYNRYGGASLYCAPAGLGVSNAGTAYFTDVCPQRATKVSYNRPFDTRSGNDARSFVFSTEYPMVRFLEANGYDVKYWAGVDTDRRGSDLVGANRPKAFMSSGHDEYWSGDQRTRIEAARNLGVHLAFFSGNEMYWKTRYEPSIDGSNTAYRTLVTYKESLAAAKIDPALDAAGNPIWTGTWRDPRFSPPADGGRPENGVTGTIWTVNSGTTAISVPASMAHLRFWQNTRVAALTSGVATLTPETLGYEWNEDLDNGARPAGLVHLSSTTVAGVDKIVDFGATTGTGTATHTMTLYRHASGALVFDAGTVQWAWGLDSTHDGGSNVPDQAMQQSTMNLLADMGAQPLTRQLGLFPATATTDTVPPTSLITSPAPGSSVPGGTAVTISGTAGDSGGAVAGVEVSVDGGATWHIAQGTTAWTYNWAQPGPLGSVAIRSRALDDSGNLEVAGAGVGVSVIAGAAGNCPCTTIWKPSAVPGNLSVTDTNPVELGVKFKSDIGGFITAVRFYKGPTAFGTHQASLWTASGTRLATANFTSETAGGWQQVNFTAPVPITANTTYVASYHNNLSGGYAADAGYFANTGVDSWPLHALQSDTISGGNGVYTYGPTAFPTHLSSHANYWVDVVFAQTSVDTTDLDISNINVVVIDGSRATITWTTSRDATSRIDYSTDPNFPPASTFTAQNGAFVSQHSLTLTGLTPNATYNYTITAVDHLGVAGVADAPSFSVPGPTLHDTSSVDFLAGTQSNTYVAESVNGEVTLAPTAGAEFSGPALPTGWTEVQWAPEGYSIIDNGVLLVDGARVASCVTDAGGVCLTETTTSTPSAIYTSPHSLEFSANFSGDQSQHAGLGQTLASGAEPWAVFSTMNGGRLFARTNPGSGSVDTDLGTGLLGAFHRYRIDWTPAGVSYYVDGGFVVTHPLSIGGPLRPIAASDFNPFGGIVFVDWMRMTPYAASGTFLSRIFDAQSQVDWHAIQWVAKAPSGTSVAISVRTGNTATPDATWSAFVVVAAPGPLTQHSRYIQYRAALTTSDSNVTPSLDDIILSTDHAPVAVNDAAATNADTSRLFPAAGAGSLKFNDTDADPTDILSITAVTAPAHGTAVLSSNGSVTYAPAAGFTGNDSFTYTLSDGLLTATGTVSMTVGGTTGVNSAPVANNQNVSATEDTAAPIMLTATDDSSTSIDSVLTYIIVASPSHGTLMAAAAGSPAITYTPTLNYNGPDSFTFKANDGSLDSNIATVSITVAAVNDAPVANSQLVPVTEDTATPITLTASDVDSTGLTYSIVAAPAHGTLSGIAPALTYTPALNYNGPDSFTFKARDASLDSNVATVAITVNAVNDAPLANGQSVPVIEDTATSITLTASDVDSTALTYSIVASPAHGTLSGTAPAVVYTPALNYNGPDSFTFKARDGSLDSNVALVSITVTPVNDAPAANGQSVSVGEDTATPITLTASDVDSTALTYSIVAGPAHGTLSGTAPALTYTPALNYAGPDSFTFKARDASLDSNIATVAITVNAVNDAPVANGQAVTTNEDVAKAIALTASDVDSTALTYSVVTGPAHGTLTGTAPNVTYNPTPAYNGPDSFTFKASDGLLSSNVATVSITVTPVNDAPVANAQTVVTNEDTAKAVTLTATDIDSPTLTYSVVTAPAHGALTGTAPNVTYVPTANYNGPDSFTFKASDGALFSNVATVSITVSPVNDAPIANAQTATVSQNVAKAIALVATDVDSPTLTYSIVTGPLHGALSGTAPNLTYKPTTSYLGADSFTFKASDGALFSNVATVSITVTPPAATLKVNYTAFVIKDITTFPSIDIVPVPNAVIRVFVKKDSCPNGVIVSGDIKMWSKVFETCPFFATGTTNTAGNVDIGVPPTMVTPDSDYVVIGKSPATGAYFETIYSEKTLATVTAGEVKPVQLYELRISATKRLPANNNIEEFGTYLNIVEPEYLEFTSDQEQYPIVLVAEGAWDVASSVATPDGFVPDSTSISSSVTDSISAVQFMISDVGSDWTQTNVTHVINHKGTTRIRSVTPHMINRKPTKAKPDFTTVDPNSTTPMSIDVLGNDNVAPPKTLTITAVTQGANGSVAMASDGLSLTYLPNAGFRGRDTFTYSIDDGAGGVDTGTVNVRVNNRPSLTISDVSVMEGNSGTTPAVFTVTLSSAVEGDVVFDYATVDNTAIAGIDYTIGSGTLVIPAGSTTATISVPVIGNTMFQPNRNFAVKLSSIVNKSAVVFGGAGKGQIVDDDPKPSISVAPVSVVEGNSGQTQAVVTVTLSGSTALPATVDYKTVDGTATAGSDYTAVSGTLTFAPGDTTATFIVLVNGDTTAEANETFSVRLNNATGATLSGNKADVTIVDDDH